MRTLPALALLVACKGTPTATPPTECGVVGFADRDGDGFGNPDLQTSDCVEPVVQDNTDCDDQNFAANPDGDEVCDNLDNDCDGLTDTEDDSLDRDLQFPDLDSDGYGGGNGVLSCEDLVAHVAIGGDCAEGDPLVNPDALEVCDGVDNDCDTLVDDDDPDLDALLPFFLDDDGDGFGGPILVTACEQPPGTALFDDDCDDADPVTYPGAIEICDNLDQDCDGDGDVPQFSPDPCVDLEAPYTGTYSVTVDDGTTLVTCTGTADLTLDRSQPEPFSGTVTCDVDAPQNGWAAAQTGTITGLFRVDGTFDGTIEAFEGVTYDFTGTIAVEDSLDFSGSGNFISSGSWDLNYSVETDWVEVPP